MSRWCESGRRTNNSVFNTRVTYDFVNDTSTILPQDKPDRNNRFILLFNEYVPGGKFVSRAPHIWAWLDLLTLILQNLIQSSLGVTHHLSQVDSCRGDSLNFNLKIKLSYFSRRTTFIKIMICII